jgi:hypothetical protein
MSTPRQIEANRRNAQKSTGPRSVEGRARSRLNAVKHGMTARLDVLSGDDPELLNERTQAWQADLKPRSTTERELIERIARISLQLERAERAHVAHLSARILEATAGMSPSDDPIGDFVQINGIAALDRLAFDESEEGERLRRYESSRSRALFRTFNDFCHVCKAGAGGKIVMPLISTTASTELRETTDHEIPQIEPNSASVDRADGASAPTADHQIHEIEPNFDLAD